MERLTFDGNFCDIAQCRELPCPQYGSRCTQRKVWEKLKAYEDLGFEPEEVNDAVVGAKLMAKSQLVSAFGVAAERLLELAEADKDGRVVVLPCKVGDTVYTLTRTFDGDDVVGEAELWWSDIPQLGKTVFLTREEAEKALEAMKDA